MTKSFDSNDIMYICMYIINLLYDRLTCKRAENKRLIYRVMMLLIYTFERANNHTKTRWWLCVSDHASIWLNDLRFCVLCVDANTGETIFAEASFSSASQQNTHIQQLIFYLSTFYMWEINEKQPTANPDNQFNTLLLFILLLMWSFLCDLYENHIECRREITYEK